MSIYIVVSVTMYALALSGAILVTRMVRTYVLHSRSLRHALCSVCLCIRLTHRLVVRHVIFCHVVLYRLDIPVCALIVHVTRVKQCALDRSGH